MVNSQCRLRPFDLAVESAVDTCLQLRADRGGESVEAFEEADIFWDKLVENQVTEIVGWFDLWVQDFREELDKALGDVEFVDLVVADEEGSFT